MYLLTKLQQKQVSGGDSGYGNGNSNDGDEGNYSSTTSSYYYQNIYINNSVLITNSSLNSDSLNLDKTPVNS